MNDSHHPVQTYYPDVATTWSKPQIKLSMSTSEATQSARRKRPPIKKAKTESPYLWTTGGRRRITHVALINRGGSGEVHKMKNERTGEVFARKLVRLFGGVTKDDIENEARAISKLCSPPRSDYIVEVLKHGWLPGDSSCYFIDMELCFETLEEKIFKYKDSGLYRSNRLLERWEFDEILDIAVDIASGLEYIHNLGAVHRDLKPRNVLHSETVWKLADFGTTSEATSKSLNTTRYGRGTACYRAPEILEENGRFNNKSDIWSLGCIVYELCVGQKAFASDWSVLQYSVRRQLSLPAVWPESFRDTTLPGQVKDMLALDPSQRPKAEHMSQAWCLV